MFGAVLSPQLDPIQVRAHRTVSDGIVVKLVLGVADFRHRPGIYFDFPRRVVEHDELFLGTARFDGELMLNEAGDAHPVVIDRRRLEDVRRVHAPKRLLLIL